MQPGLYNLVCVLSTCGSSGIECITDTLKRERGTLPTVHMALLD